MFVASYGSAGQPGRMGKFTYVYVLQSERDPSHFYTGRTDDLRERLIRHNSGKVPHTAKWNPGGSKPTSRSPTRNAPLNSNITSNRRLVALLLKSACDLDPCDLMASESVRRSLSEDGRAYNRLIAPRTAAIRSIAAIGCGTPNSMMPSITRNPTAAHMM